MSITPRLPVIAIAGMTVVAFLMPRPAAAQAMFDGYWQPLQHQDPHNYAAGPDPGEFPGLPLTDAARKIASHYDENEMMIKELQCRPFASTYGPRALSTLKIWETRDPETQEQLKIETTMAFAVQHRTIWMPASGVKEPPPSAQHTWQGFSTGRWVGNVLWVHTTHLKEFYLQRSQGLPLSDQTVMDERIFRYGNTLVDIMIISDPAYLAEPFVYSKMYNLIPNGSMGPYPCEARNHLPMPDGFVPMRLPFYTTIYNKAFMEHGIPLEAAKGGPETLMPEYQDVMKTLPANPPTTQVLEEGRKQQAQQDAIREESQ